jgi:hypothetical protein
MTAAVEMRRRNRRLALALVGLFALMYLGSVAYIDWVDAGGPGPATVQEQ